ACREAGVPVDVVPGVSSALSVPALADIPLTHRGTVAAFHVTSGHDGLDAGALAGVRDRTATLVVLMGVSQLARITAQALGAGADPALPVAIVESGSTPRQRVTRATLGDVVARAAQGGVRAPAIIVRGDGAEGGRRHPAPPGLQVLGLVASNGIPTPLTCTEDECSAHLSAFCLQQAREAPASGTAYAPAEGGRVTLVATTADGRTLRLPGEPHLAFESR